jgi:hypothetical protein
MLSGWIDAAGAAGEAASTVADACTASPIVRFDDDTYVDYRARRPVMELRDGVNTNLRWSTIELAAGRSPGGRDVLVLSGPEPDMAWRRFGRAVVTLATELGVERMVAFGAYPFAAPHTRPSRLSVSSPSTEVLARVPYERASIDVPAGAAAALEHAMHAARIPAIGLWAQVPHYVSTMSYPAASIALLQGFAEVTGIEVPASELAAEAGAVAERLDRLVADNAEHAAMLRQLEEVYDLAAEAPAADPGLELRSGDELAEEIQEFLRGDDESP